MKKLLESDAGLIRRFRAQGASAIDYLVRRFKAQGTAVAAYDVNRFREAGTGKAVFDTKRRRLLSVVALIAKSALFAFLITASIVLGVVGIAALYYYAI